MDTVDGSQIAVLCEDTSLTHAESDDAAARLAAGL
jgi:hypothetical protein